MTQNTLVIKVPPERQAELEQRLKGEDFEWRQVPHARFSVRGAGAVATLYTSGKFVVQGSDPQLFLARYTNLESQAGSEGTESSGCAPETTAPPKALDEAQVGSDEVGKGDYFGPLVVAAVRLEPDEARELVEWGVADSKRIKDPQALKLGSLLRNKVRHCVESLQPPEYNQAHSSYGNLNPLLAALHAKAIRAVAEPGERVLVDQFADASLMERELQGSGLRLEQEHRAERYVTVAAASILARAEFLLALDELSNEFGVPLHKGAGAPTDRAGVAYVRQHGPEALSRVAKVHFKNTLRIRGGGQ